MSDDLERKYLMAIAENAAYRRGANGRLLAPAIADRLCIVGGEVLVKDKSGEPGAGTLDTVLDQLAADPDYAAAFVGKAATHNTPTRSKMTLSEKVAFIDANGEQAYRALPATEASKELRRGSMSVAEKVAYQTKHGQAAYFALPD